MRLHRYIALALILAVSGCGGGAESSPIVATVNGVDVRLDEFEQFLALKIGDLAVSHAGNARSLMLDEYIIRRLVLIEAVRAAIDVTDLELEQAARENPQMKSVAALDHTRDELVNDLLVEKYYRQVLLKDFRVPPEDIQKYLEQNQARLIEKPAYFVWEIRVQTREEAESLRQEVTEGMKDFSSVARLHSNAPNAGQGGLSRYEVGQLPDLLEKAVAPLRPGDVSRVVQSSFGFHIFKLERRIQPAPMDSRRSQPDEKRARIAEEYIARRNQEIVEAALQRLVESASITVHDQALGFTYEGRLRHN